MRGHFDGEHPGSDSGVLVMPVPAFSGFLALLGSQLSAGVGAAARACGLRFIKPDSQALGLCHTMPDTSLKPEVETRIM